MPEFTDDRRGVVQLNSTTRHRRVGGVWDRGGVTEPDPVALAAEAALTPSLAETVRQAAASLPEGLREAALTPRES